MRDLRWHLDAGPVYRLPSDAQKVTRHDFVVEDVVELGNASRDDPEDAPLRLVDEPRGLSILQAELEAGRVVAIMCAGRAGTGCAPSGGAVPSGSPSPAPPLAPGPTMKRARRAAWTGARWPRWPRPRPSPRLPPIPPAAGWRRARSGGPSWTCRPGCAGCRPRPVAAVAGAVRPGPTMAGAVLAAVLAFER